MIALLKHVCCHSSEALWRMKTLAWLTHDRNDRITTTGGSVLPLVRMVSLPVHDKRANVLDLLLSLPGYTLCQRLETPTRSESLISA